MEKIDVFIYAADSGKAPFIEWLKKLDIKSRAIVRTRIDRVKNGNFGDCKQIKNGQGIWEFRIKFGAGYRIYFGKSGNLVIILLLGGNKKSQIRDIAKAKEYWQKWKENKNA